MTSTLATGVFVLGALYGYFSEKRPRFDRFDRAHFPEAYRSPHHRSSSPARELEATLHLRFGRAPFGF